MFCCTVADESGSSPSVEAELHGIVKEYLMHSNLSDTAQMFTEECHSHKKLVADLPSTKQSKDAGLITKNKLMAAFRSGEKQKFFKLWKELIPINVQHNSKEYKKLEFYLHISFATHPFTKKNKANEDPRTQKKNQDAAMREFKTFLETKGAPLAQTSEFLPYYALPFVSDPERHPNFKELFTDSWILNQHQRLDAFLTEVLVNASPPPQLVQIYLNSLYRDGSSSKSGSVMSLNQMKNDLTTSEHNLTIVLKKYNRLQSSYENLLEIATDLVTQLENTIKGIPINPDYLKMVCDKLFQSKSVLSSNADQMLSLSRMAASQRDGRVYVLRPGQLNFASIKKDLVAASDKRVALLLQALRWRLTKARPKSLRDQVLASYIENDLLGCNTPGQYQVTILKLLKSAKGQVREHIGRLFNVFASLPAGRAYLAQNVDLAKVMFFALKKEAKESITHEMMLGTLQKISLRRLLQKTLIDIGVLEWVVDLLRDHDSLSDYSLEYAGALMMNLCLCKAGRLRCEAMAQDALKILSDMIGHENQEFNMFIIGALYSILAVPSIREAAQRMSLQDALECFLTDKRPNLKRAVECLIRRLQQEEDVGVQSSDSGGDDDDDDDDAASDDSKEDESRPLDSNLNKAEILVPDLAELSGEELLVAEYASIGDKSQKTETLGGTKSPEQLRRSAGMRQSQPNSPSPKVSPRATPRKSMASKENTPREKVPSEKERKESATREMTVESYKTKPHTHEHKSPPHSTKSSPRKSSGTPVIDFGSLTPAKPVPVPPVSDSERDKQAEKIVAKALGRSRPMQKSKDDLNRPLKPSKRSLKKANANLDEYSAIFSSRPRVCRSPSAPRRADSTDSDSLQDGQSC